MTRILFLRVIAKTKNGREWGSNIGNNVCFLCIHCVEDEQHFLNVNVIRFTDWFCDDWLRNYALMKKRGNSLIYS